MILWKSLQPKEDIWWGSLTIGFRDFAFYIRYSKTTAVKFGRK